MAKKEKLCYYSDSGLTISLLYNFEDSARSNEVVSVAGIGFVRCSSFISRVVVYESSLHQNTKPMVNLSQREVAFLSQLRCEWPTI